MKLAFNTLLYGPNEIMEAIKDISKAGYQGMEINPKHVFGSDLSNLNEILKEHNLEISCIMSGWLEDKKILEEVKEVTNIAHELNTKIIGILPPRRKKIKWRKFKSLLKEAVKITEKENLELVLHHHGGCSVENPSEIKEILKKVNNLNLLFDSAHYYPYGDIIEGFNTFKERISYVHLKDIKPPWGFEQMVKELSKPPSNVDAVINYFRSFTDLGKGVIKFKPLIEEIKKSYNGWLTVEIEDLRMGTRFNHAAHNFKYLTELGV